MAFSSIIMLPLLLLFLAIWAGLIYLLILLIRALRKYLRGGEARREKAETRPHPWERSSRPTGCAAR